MAATYHEVPVMEMRRAFLLAAGFAFACSGPVHAQGYAQKAKPMVDTQHLQQTQFFHYRPFVGIEDTDPIVSDWRHRAKSTPLVVPIPPLEDGGAGGGGVPQGALKVGDNVYMVPASAGGVGASNPMLGDRGYLQPAGPRSYVHQQPITAGRDLPMGTTTGIHGALRAPSMVAPAGGVPTQHAVAKPVRMAGAEPMAMTYREPVGSVGGHTGTTVKTNTTAKLLGKIK